MPSRGVKRKNAGDCCAATSSPEGAGSPESAPIADPVDKKHGCCDEPAVEEPPCAPPEPDTPGGRFLTVENVEFYGEGKAKRIAYLETQMVRIKSELCQLLSGVDTKLEKEYVFVDCDTKQKVSMLEMFGDRDELIVAHLMGKGCIYCATWATGLIGLAKVMESRCAFFICSKDTPEVQAEMKRERGYTFRMLSDHEGTFTEDLKMITFKGDQWNIGFSMPEGFPTPGYTVYVRKGNDIYLHAKAYHGPNSVFSPLFTLFNVLSLLPGGPMGKGWALQYNYMTPPPPKEESVETAVVL